jgi:cardiolipin synthase
MRRAPRLSPSPSSIPSGPALPSLEPRRRAPLLPRKVQLGLLHSLSLSRLGLAVLFIMTSSPLLRAGLIALAGVTDVLDGWIARHARLATRLGALIDPIADRGFAVTALLMLLLDGLLTPVQVGLLLVRDVATAVGFVVARFFPALRPVEFKARMLGKATTAVQTVTMLAALLAPAVVRPLIALVAVLAVAAVVDYAWAVWRARIQR